MQNTLKRQLLNIFPIQKVSSQLLLLNNVTQHKNFAAPKLRKHIINMILNNSISCIAKNKIVKFMQNLAADN